MLFKITTGAALCQRCLVECKKTKSAWWWAFFMALLPELCVKRATIREVEGKGPLASPLPPLPLPKQLPPPSVYLNEMYVDVCGHVPLWTQSPGRKLPLTAACTAAFCQLPLLSKLHPCVRLTRPVKCCGPFLCLLLGIWVFRSRILSRQLRYSTCF